MGTHSGFDLLEGTVVREVDQAFGNGATSSSPTVVTQHTKSFHAPQNGDWWKFTIWGTMTDGGFPDSKHIVINFGATTSIDIASAAGDSGDYILTAAFVQYASGLCSYYYHFNPDPGSGTEQVSQATSTAFPTAAGDITVQVYVSDSGDSINTKGIIIETGGNG